MPKKITVYDSLLSKIFVNVKTDCWEWTGSKQTDGYGALWDGRANRRAHRISYEIHVGPIPSGMLVLHRCDNRICVNPKHLFVGTDAENVADKVTKGRQARGAALPQTKLTEADVMAIRSSTGMRQVDLAARHGVSQQLISRIRSGQLWRI